MDVLQQTLAVMEDLRFKARKMKSKENVFLASKNSRSVSFSTGIVLEYLMSLIKTMYLIIFSDFAISHNSVF